MLSEAPCASPDIRQDVTFGLSANAGSEAMIPCVRGCVQTRPLGEEDRPFPNSSVATRKSLDVSRARLGPISHS